MELTELARLAVLQSRNIAVRAAVSRVERERKEVTAEEEKGDEEVEE